MNVTVTYSFRAALTQAIGSTNGRGVRCEEDRLTGDKISVNCKSGFDLRLLIDASHFVKE